MEHSFKIGDITYKSEFIPPFWADKIFLRNRQKGGIQFADADRQLK